MLNQGPIIVH